MGRAGRVALHSFCQNFCEVQEDNTLTTDVDESATGNCEAKGKDLKNTGFKRCPKDPATGLTAQGCAARDDICQQFCRNRGTGPQGTWPADTCSRKAGQHDHLCDLDSGFQNMEIVLRRHCTKECDETLMAGGGGYKGKLCRETCEPNPDVAGKMQLIDGAEEAVCKKEIYEAWECQETNCNTRSNKFDECVENNINGKGRVKNECRAGGAVWDNFVQCTTHKCQKKKVGLQNHQFIWDLRQQQLDECADATGTVPFSSCLAEKIRDFFVGADTPAVSADVFEAI